jgi:hypothetical protein
VVACHLFGDGVAIDLEDDEKANEVKQVRSLKDIAD